jgi:protein-tyrosine phosphatase
MNPNEMIFYPKTDEVLKALRDLRRSTKKAPTLLHCENGSDRTGLITALYRIIYEDWSPAQAVAELEEPRFGFHYWYWSAIVGYIQSSRNIDFLKQQLGVTSRR